MTTEDTKTSGSTESQHAVGSQVDRGVRPAGPERKEFETWATECWMLIDDKENAWDIWRAAVAAERERCKRIVQLNQYRNGHHTHDGTTMGHYNVEMIAEIDAGLPPRA